MCVRCCWRPVIINALKIVLMTGSCVNVVVFLPRPVNNIRKSCRLFRLDCEQRRKLNLFVCCCWFFLINSFGGNEPTMAIGAAASLHFIIRQRGPATNGWCFLYVCRVHCRVKFNSRVKRRAQQWVSDQKKKNKNRKSCWFLLLDSPSQKKKKGRHCSGPFILYLLPVNGADVSLMWPCRADPIRYT